jgi:4-diphosphocytidyl-2-C-methyl-D-erythritol kinase
MHAFSHAKINLFLNIIGKKDDGYHKIQSYFVLLNLCDHITLEYSHIDKCVVEDAEIEGKNIVLKTIDFFREFYDIKNHFDIHITKKIPVSAGLGGGSSNAATVLNMLYSMFDIKDKEKIPNKIVAYKIGADVPFFLNSKNAFIEGIGEIISPKFWKKNLYILLINPNIEVSTKDVYKNILPYDTDLNLDTYDDNKILSNIINGKNDLEFHVQKKYPVIKDLLYSMKTYNKTSRMSGSGSTCFSMFDTKADMLSGYNYFSKQYPNYWMHYEKILL